MPELPEVECLARTLRHQVLGGTITHTKFYRQDLRGKIPVRLFNAVLKNQEIQEVSRRSKYILLRTQQGYGIIHLGMTGNILAHTQAKPERKHVHAVWTVESSQGETLYLHYVDPRRFGQIQCMRGHSLEEHPFFHHLGPEPLEERSLGDKLWKKSRQRKTPIKNFLMDAKNVVGVGNIYASESLFRSGISPLRAAGEMSSQDFSLLAKHVKATLREAIKAGGTSFRDYKSLAGEPGYFKIALKVYGRKDEPCLVCKKPIRQVVQAGRSSFYCEKCQK